MPCGKATTVISAASTTIVHASRRERRRAEEAEQTEAAERGGGGTASGSRAKGPEPGWPDLPDPEPAQGAAFGIYTGQAAAAPEAIACYRHGIFALDAVGSGTTGCRSRSHLWQ